MSDGDNLYIINVDGASGRTIDDMARHLGEMDNDVVDNIVVTNHQVEAVERSELIDWFEQLADMMDIEMNLQ